VVIVLVFPSIPPQAIAAGNALAGVTFGIIVGVKTGGKVEATRAMRAMRQDAAADGPLYK
jgi:hypothetical protein